MEALINGIFMNHGEHNHGEHSNMKRILKELLLTKSKCQRIIDGRKVRIETEKNVTFNVNFYDIFNIDESEENTINYITQILNFVNSIGEPAEEARKVCWF